MGSQVVHRAYEERYCMEVVGSREQLCSLELLQESFGEEEDEEVTMVLAYLKAAAALGFAMTLACLTSWSVVDRPCVEVA